MRLPAEVAMRSLSGSAVGWAVVWAVAACALPARADAQVALSAGTDGGVTVWDADVQFVDPTTRWRDPAPTVALGIDMAGYYLPSEHVALGLAMSPAFYAAGPEPSPGINFAIGPRFVWRGGRAHVAADAGFVLSAFNDRCNFEDPAFRVDCPPTRDFSPAAAGFGVGFAPMVRVATVDEVVDVLVGPAFRYQSARFAYDGDDGFVLRTFQAVLAMHLFVDLTPEPPR